MSFMSGNVFVDTNILVYAHDRAAGVRHDVAAQVMDACWSSGTGRISVQVLNEFFVTVTRKLKPGMPPEKAWEHCSVLFAWNPMGLDVQVMEEGWRIYRRYKLSWWDALIVGTAILSRCEVLYSEDLVDGQLIDGVRIVNPFNR
jgi:predicted nucleic acid-binding protein